MGDAIVALLSPLVHSLRKAATNQARRRVLTLVDAEFAPLTDYENKPTEFCRDILGVALTPIQIEIAEGLRDNPRVSVAACYASGKTFLAACGSTLVRGRSASRPPQRSAKSETYCGDTSAGCIARRE